MYIYIYVCMSVSMGVFTCVRVHVCVCAYVCTHALSQPRLPGTCCKQSHCCHYCICIDLYIHTHTHTYMYLYTHHFFWCMYDVCRHACMCMYAYTYIQIHIIYTHVIQFANTYQGSIAHTNTSCRTFDMHNRTHFLTTTVSIRSPDRCCYIYLHTYICIYI